MRELTPQEIANAPDCDTHYGIWDDGVLDYYDFSGEACVNDERLFIDGFEFAKIPRKEFDISEYEFSDGDISIHNVIWDRYELYVVSECIELNKQDVIALAKHFKLTSGDLK